LLVAAQKRIGIAQRLQKGSERVGQIVVIGQIDPHTERKYLRGEVEVEVEVEFEFEFQLEVEVEVDVEEKFDHGSSRASPKATR